jgi:hypothetical protein
MDELLRVAHKLGLRVRVEPFETAAVLAGGLCWVRGRQLILLDENASMVDRVAAMAEALANFDLETVYLAPEARQLVEAALARGTRADETADRLAPTSTLGGSDPAVPQQSGNAGVRELLIPKPGLRSTIDRAARNGEDDQ